MLLKSQIICGFHLLKITYDYGNIKMNLFYMINSARKEISLHEMELTEPTVAVIHRATLSVQNSQFTSALHYGFLFAT